MDSCYSGGVSERKARDVKIADDPYTKLAEGEGRIVIAASQPNQFSFEDSNLKHGVFTYNLLEALSGKADWDNDGYVTILDTYKYLQDRVPRDAMKLAGGAQEPILRGDITKDFVISVNRERFETNERIFEEKLRTLQNFYDDGKLSGKLYEKLRGLLKTESEELTGNERIIVKRINDLLSGNISITTFLEDLQSMGHNTFGTSEREEERREPKRLYRLREEKKEGESKVQAELKAGDLQKNVSIVNNYCPKCRLENNRKLNYCTKCGTLLSITKYGSL